MNYTGRAAGANHKFKAYVGQATAETKAWRTIALPAVADGPSVQSGFVVRPEFTVGQTSVIGSYAFLVNLNSNTNILLTALHVLDEVATLNNIDLSHVNSNYTGLELPGLIGDVVLYDAMAEQWMFEELGVCKGMLVLRDARIGDEEPNSGRDIAAFHATNNTKYRPGVLAAERPSVGESVWLASRAGPNQLTSHAVVVESSKTRFVYRYANSTASLQYTSGAPVLNEAGEVVAINVGLGQDADYRYGHGSSVSSIREHLANTASAIELQ